jgi:hypothetical protein
LGRHHVIRGNVGVINPKCIEDWAFSGWDGGDLGHTWLIKACKQEKPCK